jgi:uncharacterized protein YbjT (DUF2867 family)
VAEAARAGGVGRIAFLSYVGAVADSDNAYLSVKGEAEEVLTASGIPTAVLRCLHIYGPPEHPGPTAGAFIAAGPKAVVVPAAASSGSPRSTSATWPRPWSER